MTSGTWFKWKNGVSYPIYVANVLLIFNRSEALLDQLRKKAQFYKHNVLLVPHGDDFRYTSDEEWKKQTENLKKLFAYMNSRPDMKVKVRPCCITI